MALGVLFHIWVILRREKNLISNLLEPLAWPATAGILLVVLLFAPFGNNPFIYFGF